MELVAAARAKAKQDFLKTTPGHVRQRRGWCGGEEYGEVAVLGQAKDAGRHLTGGGGGSSQGGILLKSKRTSCPRKQQRSEMSAGIFSVSHAERPWLPTCSTTKPELTSLKPVICALRPSCV
mmetsp:Transcript_28785/g.48619  ORF Transcript_28785/g.48619 Transcript_28785/m.48619 type:complete len:122 (-) Transcript_28785:116-481(-)